MGDAAQASTKTLIASRVVFPIRARDGQIVLQPATILRNASCLSALAIRELFTSG
jgi:hypothetical protein